MQESNLIEKLEALQKKGADWWNMVSKEDKQTIDEGLEQLDGGCLFPRLVLQ